MLALDKNNPSLKYVEKVKSILLNYESICYIDFWVHAYTYLLVGIHI